VNRAPAPKSLWDESEEWDDEGRAALDEIALEVVERYSDSRHGPPATFEDVFISIAPYESTWRKNDRDRMIVSLDYDQESRDALSESLARLVAAGHVERVSALVDGKPEVQYVITVEGRRHLRALQES